MEGFTYYRSRPFDTLLSCGVHSSFVPVTMISEVFCKLFKAVSCLIQLSTALFASVLLVCPVLFGFGSVRSGCSVSVHGTNCELRNNSIIAVCFMADPWVGR